ncbi:conserved hypothetical protein [Methylocella tundrae]|jgi:hypothetical protein|uniref:Uncharacterized protein n=1 Tax=Methylocella tundrae TaxID=227605 RepID=A0A8B6M008_METTU|nr:hypothetical protein [Methylocella tundrae]VTZ27108.1 conserved hypothetical protein [Methylocella tundrae]VTZ48148.1 conserved hypothetical protein [Methylocella tundrae]
MSGEVKYWFTGQAGYEMDCGAHKKLRVVFAMIDEDKTSIGWYLFASKADAKGQKECETTDVLITDQFAHRDDIGRLIPHTFKKKIAIDELASPKGTFATLSIEATKTSRLMGCRIARLKTKAGETVTFPFGMQQDWKPSPTDTEIDGRVFFLEKASFEEKKFPLGPQGKDAKVKIDGAVL